MADTLTPDHILDCYVNILQDHIQINNQVVDVLVEFPPEPVLPSIIIAFENPNPQPDEYMEELYSPLPEDHPYYDPEHPDKQYPQHVLYYTQGQNNLTLYLFGGSVPDRDLLYSQVIACINKARTYHYEFCTKYNLADGKCTTTDNTCDAETVSNQYSASYMCPYPKITDTNNPHYRGPDSFFNQAGINPGTLEVKTPKYEQDTSVTPELYAAIVDVAFLLDEGFIYPVSPLCAVHNTDTVL